MPLMQMLLLNCLAWLAVLVSSTRAFSPPCSSLQQRQRHMTSLAASSDRRGDDWQQNRRGVGDENRSRRSQNGNSARRREQSSGNDKQVAQPPQSVNFHSYYLATCLPGMTSVLQEELRELGCVAVEPSGTSAVNFGVPNLEIVLRVLLWTRTAHKIMELLTCSNSEEPLFTREDVYNYVRYTIPVADLLLGSDDGASDDWSTLAVSVTLNNARHIPADINHSHYTALNVKNALVDAARAEGSSLSNKESRPSVDTTDPDVPIQVVRRGIPSEARFFGSSRADNDNNANAGAAPISAGAHISVYRQIHAGSLHRRGYRSGTAVHKAAMKESMAAGLLLAAGWPNKSKSTTKILVDPMMGSGTFLVEGAMMAADLAPGLMRLRCGVPASRNPPVLRWRHDGTSDGELQKIWSELLVEATDRAKAGLRRLKADGVQIVGNDIHSGSVHLAAEALKQAGLSQFVQLSEGDCLGFTVVGASDRLETHADDDSPPAPWMVVSNPPWGVRLTDDMHESWEALRVFLRERCPGNTEAWILSGSPEATKHLGLRRSQSLPLKTGQQDLRWLQYTIRDKSEAAPSEDPPPKSSARASSESPNDQRYPSRSTYDRGVTAERSPKKKQSRSPRTAPVVNEWLI